MKEYSADPFAYVLQKIEGLICKISIQIQLILKSKENFLYLKTVVGIRYINKSILVDSHAGNSPHGANAYGHELSRMYYILKK